MVPELTLPGFRESDLYLDVLVEGRLIRLGAVRGDFGDEMPKML